MQPDLVFGLPLADAQGQREIELRALVIEGDGSRSGRLRRRPSAVTWHLVLLLGDSLLLIVLFLLYQTPIIHVGYLYYPDDVC
jgi:hypothetical protein